MVPVFFTRYSQEPSVENWKRSTDHHERLIALLRDGQIEHARQLLDEHLEAYDRHSGESCSATP